MLLQVQTMQETNKQVKEQVDRYRAELKRRQAAELEYKRMKVSQQRQRNRDGKHRAKQTHITQVAIKSTNEKMRKLKRENAILVT
mgnify:CR=1 FL=1